MSQTSTLGDGPQHTRRQLGILAPASLLLGGLLRPAEALARDWPWHSSTKGSGRMQREERRMFPFSALKIGGSLALELRHGDKPRLELEGDDNILPMIEAVVEDTTLTLRQTQGIKPTRLKMVLHTPMLDSISVSGAALVRCDAWSAQRLTLKAGGAGVLRFEGLQLQKLFAETGGSATLAMDGSVDELVAEMGGSSVLRAPKLVARSAVVKLGGSSTAVVNATQSLRVAAGGASVLRYHGQPPQTELSKSGAAAIHAVADGSAR